MTGTEPDPLDRRNPRAPEQPDENALDGGAVDARGAATSAGDAPGTGEGADDGPVSSELDLVGPVSTEPTVDDERVEADEQDADEPGPDGQVAGEQVPDERTPDEQTAEDGGEVLEDSVAAPTPAPQPQLATPHETKATLDTSPRPAPVAPPLEEPALPESTPPEATLREATPREPTQEPFAPADATEPGVTPSAGMPARPAHAQSSWRRLAHGLRPRFSRSQLLAGVLCGLLGFALVVQVRQSGSDELSSLREDDLVRLLDEVTGRAEQLDAEVSQLQASRDELASGTDKAQAALDVARARAESEGILSGRLPAQGPGVVIDVSDPQGVLGASQLFNVLEELRNAGAEVAQVNDVRLVTSSAFEDVTDGIAVDGHVLSSPYEWTVIGDPATLDRALEIPGGALPKIRSKGAEATTTRAPSVQVEATVRLEDPEFARPVEDDGGQ